MAISTAERALRDAFLNKVKEEILLCVSNYKAKGKDQFRIVQVDRGVSLGVDVLAGQDPPQVQVHLLTYDAMPQHWAHATGLEALPDDLKVYGIAPGLEDSGKVQYLGVEWPRASDDYEQDFGLVDAFARWLVSVHRAPTAQSSPVAATAVPRAARSVNGRVPLNLVDWVEPKQSAAVRSYYDDLLRRVLEGWKRSDRSSSVERATRFMLNQIVWGYTTITDEAKHDLRYVSEGAKIVLEQLARAAGERRLVTEWRKSGRALRHEHVHTRRSVVEQLMNGKMLRELDPEACLVTVEEHERLGGEDDAGWARYRSAGIRVWDRATGSWSDRGA